MTVSVKNNYNDFRFIITISLFPVQCLCSSFMGVSRKTFGRRGFAVSGVCIVFLVLYFRTV